MKLTLKEIRKEAQNAYSLIFHKPENFTWNPGEYISLKIPHENKDLRGEERTFSISSAPSENVVMITTRNFKEKGSSFKKELFNLKEGDNVTFTKPSVSPTFFNASDESKTYIFLTAGIGITPVRSVIMDYSLLGKTLKGTLLYANRDDEYIFDKELDEAIKNLPNFTIQKYHGKRINREVLEEILIQYNNPIFNISGTLEFISEMRETLLNQLNVSIENVKSSSFGKGYSNS
ncbi:FAD-dependent oxidoreductase [Candidatus Dojkabacteria bacterium]|nr:FAD-dependent oxidoreductase [Candidatus Dojkabacteria bacterium]